VANKKKWEAERPNYTHRAKTSSGEKKGLGHLYGKIKSREGELPRMGRRKEMIAGLMVQKRKKKGKRGTMRYRKYAK